MYLAGLLALSTVRRYIIAVFVLTTIAAGHDLCGGDHHRSETRDVNGGYRSGFIAGAAVLDDVILDFGVDVACEDLSASSWAFCLSRCLRQRVVRSLGILPRSAREVLGGGVYLVLGAVGGTRVAGCGGCGGGCGIGCGCDVTGGDVSIWKSSLNTIGRNANRLQIYVPGSVAKVGFAFGDAIHPVGKARFRVAVGAVPHTFVERGAYFLCHCLGMV
uniref:Secreted protein n=1 Tax=Romanomermis culicivorax TaxID=13658 RepID=A0A915J955_ROMCU